MYDRVLALFAAVPYASPTKKEDDHDDTPWNVDLTPHLTNSSLQIERGEEGVHLIDELSGCHILSGDDRNRRALFMPEDIENIKVQMCDVLAETFKAAVEMPIHFQVRSPVNFTRSCSQVLFSATSKCIRAVRSRLPSFPWPSALTPGTRVIRRLWNISSETSGNQFRARHRTNGSKASWYSRRFVCCHRAGCSATLFQTRNSWLCIKCRSTKALAKVS